MAAAFTGGPVLAMQACPAEAQTRGSAATAPEPDHSCCVAPKHDAPKHDAPKDDADSTASDASTNAPTDHCTPECMAVCCAVVATFAAPERLGVSIDLSTPNPSFVHLPTSAGPADPQSPPPRI